MRVLWLTSSCPLPANDGNRRRNVELLSAVARHHEVTLVAPATAEESVSLKALSSLGVNVRPATRMTAHRGRVVAAVCGQPSCIVPPQLAAMRQLAQASRQGPFDLAFTALSTAPALVSGHVRLQVIDDQNVETELYRRLWIRERPGARKVARFLDWRAVRAFERRWLPRADLITACSARDAGQLEPIAPGRPVIVVPNGVDLDAVPFGANERDPTELVMVGGMSWAPNIEAARILVEAVMPEVWRVRPEARVTLVGKDPAPEILKLAGPRVTVTGEVESVTPYLHRAALSVVPLMSGGGTRLKILEAMAAGTPVVTTFMGAEGIAVEHARTAWLAETVEEVGRGVITLLGDTARARRMASAAREVVETRYGWAAIGERFVGILEKLARDAA